MNAGMAIGLARSWRLIWFPSVQSQAPLALLWWALAPVPTLSAAILPVFCYAGREYWQRASAVLPAPVFSFALQITVDIVATGPISFPRSISWRGHSSHEPRGVA